MSSGADESKGEGNKKSFTIWNKSSESSPEKETIMSEAAAAPVQDIEAGKPAVDEKLPALIEVQTTPEGSQNNLESKDMESKHDGRHHRVSHSVWRRLTKHNATPEHPPQVTNPDPYPYPKWPANHTAGTFDAVAVKKSYILSPPEIYAECAHHGEEKSKYPWYKMLLLTMVAGCYVGFGFTLCLLVGGQFTQGPTGPAMQRNVGLFKLVFGAVGFPFAFTTIVVCGAELYTSLCAYMMAAWWEGYVDIFTCIRVWVISWIGNFAGCGIFVGLMCASGIYDGQDAFLKVLVFQKTHHPWGEVFVRGIFANWLVGIATWMANAAQDLTGKAVGIWLPISAFAMIGFEHCIANQFVIPMGIAMGADISAKAFVWQNLIPATLGNWVGGAICLSTTYAFTYGRPPLIIKKYLADHPYTPLRDRKH